MSDEKNQVKKVVDAQGHNKLSANITLKAQLHSKLNAQILQKPKVGNVETKRE